MRPETTPPNPLLCEPGWLRRIETYAAKCSLLNTLQSEVYASP